jgi:hypothetical protein
MPVSVLSSYSFALIAKSSYKVQGCINTEDNRFPIPVAPFPSTCALRLPVCELIYCGYSFASWVNWNSQPFPRCIRHPMLDKNPLPGTIGPNVDLLVTAPPWVYLHQLIRIVTLCKTKSHTFFLHMFDSFGSCTSTGFRGGENRLEVPSDVPE